MIAIGQVTRVTPARYLRQTVLDGQKEEDLWALNGRRHGLEAGRWAQVAGSAGGLLVDDIPGRPRLAEPG